MDASGKSIEKLATFETTKHLISPLLNKAYNSSRSFTGVSPLIIGTDRSAAISSICEMYCPIINT